jgi:hypothetical protein
MKLTVDIDAVSFRDLAVIDDWRMGRASFSDVLAIYRRLFGDEADTWPVARLKAVNDAIGAAIRDSQSPNASGIGS